MNATVAAAPLATPELTCRSFAEALEAGRVEQALAAFTADARLITPDATALRGHKAIRPVLAQLVAAGTKISIESSVLRFDRGVADVRQRWQIRSGTAREILIRSVDAAFLLGREELGWRLTLAAPWGWSAEEPAL
jgi:hypothetical protein